MITKRNTLIQPETSCNREDGTALVSRDRSQAFLLGDAMETWKDIKGWEGIYQISDHGRLKSFKRYSEGYILSNVNKTGSYFAVVLQKPGMVRRCVRIHRLVAEAFIPNPKKKPEINHKDLNKQNNRVGNLEWATNKENHHHAVKNGIDFYSGLNHFNEYIKPTPVEQITMAGKTVNAFHNCVEAGRKTGICSRNIHQVASKTEYKPGLTRKQAGGFRWEFIDGH